MGQFGEPWSVEVDEDDPAIGYVVSNSTADLNCGFPIDKANRAAACVNACEGMNDPAKEIADLRERVKELTS